MALPAFLFPIYNPDIFWHLSAGRWILEHHALPRADFLSFTLPGTPWLDFEWLSEMIFQGAYWAGGLTGLWLLKVVLLVVAWFLLDKTLRLHQVAGTLRAGALALWSAGMLAFSDIRPELFSLICFCAILHYLESRRLGKDHRGLRALVWLFALFAAWSNLHAGFVLGLVLIVIYGVAEAAQEHWKRVANHAETLTFCAAGTLCNPYGYGPYTVTWRHWLMRAELARYIKEWRAMGFDNILHWPFWAMLALCLVTTLAGLLAGRRRLPWAPIMAVLFLAWSTLSHGRAEPFFNAAAVLLVFSVAHEEGWLSRRVFRAGASAWVLAYAGYLMCAMPRVSWAGAFNYKFVPRQAAEFLARERDAVANLRAYNPWEWGGYLGWRLSPWYRVFGDGRYVFHLQLAETAAAAMDAGAWRLLMERRGLNAALLHNLDWTYRADRLYPDKTTKTFSRPWYLLYMPRERWALVYWDAQALYFVDRKAVPPDWLAGHEYRYYRPNDRAARADALSRKEIPLEKVEAERLRHEREASAPGPG